MQREAWRLTKVSKRFYVKTFRFAGRALIFSFSLNVLLSIGIIYFFTNKPLREFYATNGVVAPIQLTAMYSPNETSVPLLAADPAMNEEAQRKPIPQ